MLAPGIRRTLIFRVSKTEESVSKIDDVRPNERRKHRMYVTRNTEYHFRKGVCVAVRCRNTGNWLLGHTTLNRTISGAVSFRGGEACPTLTPPRVGEALFFGENGPDVVTSALTAVARPQKALVSAYPF